METSSLPNPTPKKPGKDFIPFVAPFPILQVDGKRAKSFIGYLENGCVMVSDEESMKSLYTMGFFGKGTFSRGGPKICYKSEDSSERDAGSPTIENKSPPDGSVEIMEVDSGGDGEQEEDCNLQETESSGKEKLQLIFEEAFFLSYGLGCLIVIDKDQPLDLQRLWHKFCKLRPGGNFPAMYTAYHHFRSKGWVVKKGLKYNADYLLYKEGPCHYHSTYAVIVKQVAEKNLRDMMSSDRMPQTWSALASQTRLLNQVSKTLIYLYVIKPDSMSDNKITTPFCISQFKLEEVHVKRWDPAAGREEEEES